MIGVMGLSGVMAAAIMAGGSATAVAPPATAIFRDHCAVCHGDAGEGLSGPPLKPLPIPAADVRAIVRQGSGQMPPFSARDLPDAALDLLVGMLTSWR